MASMLWSNHYYFAGFTVAVSASVAAYATYKLLASERDARTRKDTYETEKVLNEYLAFHYGRADQLLKYDFGPVDEALRFAKVVADEAILAFDEKGGVPLTALDVGCAVGRTSFELARKFNSVVGIDYSQAFVDTCNHLRDFGSIHYAVTEEGDLTIPLKANVDQEINRKRVTFQRGDACNLPFDLGSFGCVVAANLVCRLHNPFDFLNRLTNLVVPGGLLVITSPYTFLEEFTPKKNWIGGYRDADGREIRGFDTLRKVLAPNFDFLKGKDLPFFIRETAHKNQWSMSHATFWRRKSS